jgi:hypothetical protein
MSTDNNFLWEQLTECDFEVLLVKYKIIKKFCFENFNWGNDNCL